jgi:hypothetical protein
MYSSVSIMKIFPYCYTKWQMCALNISSHHSGFRSVILQLNLRKSHLLISICLPQFNLTTQSLSFSFIEPVCVTWATWYLLQLNNINGVKVSNSDEQRTRTRSTKKCRLTLLNFGCHILQNSLLGNVYNYPIVFSTLQKHHVSQFP